MASNKDMVYTIRKAAIRPELDGQWDGPAWRQAEPLDIAHFHKESSDHRPVTQAKALYDADGVYVIFEVKDRYVRSRHTEYQARVCDDSCVEFFVQPKPGKGYFNFEMNCGGHLLLYYSLNKRLPQTLDDLRAVSGQAEAPPSVCPVSGKPYIYRADGLRVPGLSGRLVLYDAAPAHGDMRWGIVIAQMHGGGPLTTQILLVPEESVQAAERQENAEAENRAQD